MNNLLLIGFKAAGKSYWGARLAKRLNLPFIDLDEVILKQTAKTPREIYRKEGNRVFRQREHEALCSIQMEQNSIIALGGGTPLEEENKPLLRQMGNLVYLKVSKKVLCERCQHANSALIEHRTFEELYEERLGQYETLDAHTLSLQDLSEVEIMDKLEGMYGQ